MIPLSILLYELERALIFSCFPAVFGTALIIKLLQLLNGIPYAKARKTIMLGMRKRFTTEQTIEKQMAKRYPVLYNVRRYYGVIIISIFFYIYIVSFVLIAFFYDSLSILLRGY